MWRDVVSLFVLAFCRLGVNFSLYLLDRLLGPIGSPVGFAILPKELTNLVSQKIKPLFRQADLMRPLFVECQTQLTHA
jgi:hypothetical protein